MDAPKRTVIVIEKDYALGCIAQRALRPHDVLVVGNVDEARALLETLPVDTVVFDPDEEGGGFDLLVRLATRFSSVRVVVYTLSGEAHRRLAFGTAHAILRKPASEEQLRDAVLGSRDTREFRTIRIS